MSKPGPDSADRALRMLDRAATFAGVDASDARVLRVRSSVHVELPHADVIARIEGPGHQQLASHQVQVARALADRDAPVARLVRPDIQPVLIDDGGVTFWHRIHPVAAPTYEAVGRAVRCIHDATVASLLDELPAVDPITRTLNDLRTPSSWTGSLAVKELERRVEEVASKWHQESRDDPLGRVVLHGDVHLDNAMMTDQGVILIDLEDAGVGPASWDFAPLAVGVKRYGVSASDYDRFAAGYEAESRSWQDHELMCETYELFVTSWAIRCSIDSAEMAKEAEIRVAGVLDDDPAPWSLL